jgi:hypothetical protein
MRSPSRKNKIMNITHKPQLVVPIHMIGNPIFGAKEC